MISRDNADSVFWTLILFTLIGCMAGGGLAQVVGVFTLGDAARIESLSNGAATLGAACGLVAALLILAIGGGGEEREDASDEDEAEAVG